MMAAAIDKPGQAVINHALNGSPDRGIVGIDTGYHHAGFLIEDKLRLLKLHRNVGNCFPVGFLGGIQHNRINEVQLVRALLVICLKGLHHGRGYFRRQESRPHQQPFFRGLAQPWLNRLHGFLDRFNQDIGKCLIRAFHVLHDNRDAFPVHLAHLCQHPRLIFKGTHDLAGFLDVREILRKVNQQPVSNRAVNLRHFPGHIVQESRVHSPTPPNSRVTSIALLRPSSAICAISLSASSSV